MKRQVWNAEWTFWKDGSTEKRTVDVPYDAMLQETRVPNIKDGPASGCYPGGKYFYEKVLCLTEEEAAGTVILEFGGVYQKSTVSLNGTKAGGRVYGYSDFLVDLTGKVKAGENSVLVEADNTQYGNCRWYSGSGIYRDVVLWTSGTSYIKPFGVHVTTESIAPAAVRVQTDAVMEDGMTLLVEVRKDGAVVAKDKGADVTLEIPNAKLWSAESPELYEVSVTLKKGRKVLDAAEETFGIRSIAWNAKEGFLVNGQSVKLRGGCVHADNGPLGAASFKKTEMRRLRKMKECGYNAVRYSHQPANKAFLDACDELGLYVMDETFDTWFNTKSEYDYALYFENEWEKDLTDMVRVAYNHPSVIMYSLGNEVYLKETEKSTKTAKQLVEKIHALDASRAATVCINPGLAAMGGGEVDPAKANEAGDPAPTVKGDAAKGSLLINMIVTILPKVMKILGSEKKMQALDPIFAPMDLLGFNYGTHLYLPQHKDYPDRVIVGSETLPSKLAENWKIIAQYPHLVGDFMWTSVDYLGEAGVGLPKYGGKEEFNAPYPCVTAGCGSIDLTGFIDSQGWISSIIWGQRETPYIAVHPIDHFGEKVAMGRWRMTDAVHSWSWKGCEGGNASVDVYSVGKFVELFQDGVSLGVKELSNWKASYELTYQPGKLEAISYDMAHRVLARDVLTTGSAETVLTVCPEDKTLTTGGQDITFVNIALADRTGIVKMLEDRKVTVAVEGPAELVSVCSGNPETKDDLATNTCETYHGRAVAVLRSTHETGTVKLTVSAAGMDPVSIELEAQ